MVKRCCASSCFNSQTTNRNVTYFGLPKYLSFAQKWAVAANRADLLEKKLDCLTKYFLCAEHFTYDCFVDPPNNTRLKKTNNPLNIPIPTIFKCNFDKYVPTSRLEKRKEAELGNKLFEYCIEYLKDERPDDIPSPTDQVLKIKSVVGGKSLLNNRVLIPVKTETRDTAVSFSEVIDGNDLDYLNCVNSFAEIDSFCLPDEYHNLIIEEDNPDTVAVHSMDEPGHSPLNGIYDLTCRLCAACFSSQNELTDIAHLMEKINQLLPDTIHSLDGLPQSVCLDCIEKVNACIIAVNSFKAAQTQLKANIFSNNI